MYLTYRDLLVEFQNEYPKYTIIFLTQFGSHLYGFNNENSDTDVKGIFIPSIEDLVSGKAIHQWSRSTGGKDKNTKDDIDVELFSIHQFLKDLKKGTTIALDILFANTNEDCIIYETISWNIIKRESEKLISNNISSFFGYAVGQCTKYGLKGQRLKELEDLINYIEYRDVDCSKDKKIKDIKNILEYFISVNNPEYIKYHTIDGVEYFYVLGKNYIQGIIVEYLLEKLHEMKKKYGHRTELAKDKGVDYKSLSHAFRVIEESVQLMTEGKITFPIKSAKFIKEVRSAKFDTEYLYQLLFEKLDEAKDIEKSDKNVLRESKNDGTNILLDLYGFKN